MHSVGRASTGSPREILLNCTGIAVQLRVPGQGHKTACYGFDSSGMFLPDQTTAPIPPPLFAGRVSRY